MVGYLSAWEGSSGRGVVDRWAAVRTGGDGGGVRSLAVGKGPYCLVHKCFPFLAPSFLKQLLAHREPPERASRLCWAPSPGGRGRIQTQISGALSSSLSLAPGAGGGWVSPAKHMVTHWTLVSLSS